ncbi:hypothetical protein ACWDXD_24860 [Streptomyces sp. NPDC003314]
MAAVFFDIDPTTSLVTLPRPRLGHFLNDSPDLAGVRPVRAADVRPGDRWVGTIDNARFHNPKTPDGRLRGYWAQAEFTAAPVRVEDGRIQLCLWEGEPYVVARDSWTLVVPAARPACPTWQSPAPVDDFVTLTVVVRRGGEEGDPCDVFLAGHPDVLFVGHQDGITGTARALGAEPGSWT